MECSTHQQLPETYRWRRYHHWLSRNRKTAIVIKFHVVALKPPIPSEPLSPQPFLPRPPPLPSQDHVMSHLRVLLHSVQTFHQTRAPFVRFLLDYRTIFSWKNHWCIVRYQRSPQWYFEQLHRQHIHCHQTETIDRRKDSTAEQPRFSAPLNWHQQTAAPLRWHYCYWW